MAVKYDPMDDSAMDEAASTAYDLISDKEYQVERLMVRTRSKVCGLIIAVCTREYYNNFMKLDLNELLGKFKYEDQDRSDLYGVGTMGVLESLKRNEKLLHFWVLRSAKAITFIKSNYYLCWHSYLTKPGPTCLEFLDFITGMLNIYKEEMLLSKSRTGSTTDDDSISVSLTEAELIDDKARKQDVIEMTQHIMVAINNGDYHGYKKLCDPHLTAFEPETLGNRVEGMDFHKFYFDSVISKNYKSATAKILNPHVQLLGEKAACISYIRLVQFIDKQGFAGCTQSEETRVWRKKKVHWRNIHLHRSSNASACTSGILVTQQK